MSANPVRLPLRTVARLAVVTGALLTGVACDYSGDFLFGGALEEVPGVVDLGEVTPADVENPVDIGLATIYSEVGPTGTAEQGGVTFTFRGTGGHVCVWVDPELTFWSQSVAARRPEEEFAYPDNVFDDGDLDLYAGLAAYYTGSPGERIGDFKVRYQDGLGNPVEVELNECGIAGRNEPTGAHSGRGAPEYCTLFNTQPGVNYLVLMATWSTPLDDDRLGYGVLLANGPCEDVRTAGRGFSFALDECVITGEAVNPGAQSAPGPFYGINEVPTLSGSTDFEQAFCEGGLAEFCATEASLKDCDVDHCYCGDPANTPTPGGF